MLHGIQYKSRYLAYVNFLTLNCILQVCFDVFAHPSLFWRDSMASLYSPRCHFVKSIYALVSESSQIPSQEEVDFIQKFKWLQKARLLRTQLKGRRESDWAKALGLSIEELQRSLQKAELAQKSLFAMGLRISITLAKVRCRQNIREDLSDLIHEGLLTFFDAVESFDSSRRIRLSTYAYSRIRARFTQFNRLEEKSCSIDDLDNLIKPEPFRVEVEADSEFQVERKSTLHLALESLSERQRLILVKKYGIECKVQSAQDIARTFGVSYETIRKDQNAALSFLKKNRNLKALVA
jgi:RNA polymerase sigma factor (sigma-70 family)